MMADKIKIGLAVLVITAALAGFYIYQDQSLLLRWVALLVALGVSTAILLQAEAGKAAWVFVRESTIEIRKVVWPTRKETGRSTLLVMVMVVLLGVFLWLLDMFLRWVVKLITGQGG
jgi:preprotein translocase subunit SecE